MANLKDFGTSTVATAPSPATSGTSLVVEAGHGARFPAATFYVTAHPDGELPTLDNAELLEVTAISTDTLTIVRARGDTTAKSIAIGWRVSNVIRASDYANLAGVSGGQALIGGTGSGDDLTLTSTSNATKGDVIINDTVEFFDSGYTYGGASNFIALRMTDAITMSGTGGGFANGLQILSFSSTVTYTAAGNAFGMGNIFQNNATYTNNVGLADALTGVIAFADQGTFLANTNNQTAAASTSLLSSPVFSRSNSATLTATTATAVQSNATINTGATVTTRRGFYFLNATGSGTLTSQYGIDIPALTKGATNNIGIQIALPSGATNNYAIHLSDTTGVAAGGINFGVDTNLYRSAANTLRTDDSLIARIQPRTGTTTSSATPTINTDNVSYYSLTAQTEAITSFTTNLSGTPTDNQTLWISITGTAARAITWGASFEASTVALPTTTVTTNRLDVGFVWNAATSKWRCVAVG